MPYPRICGANGGTRLRACSQFPLPPRTWGKLSNGDDGLVHGPSTPAYAGQTHPPQVSRRTSCLYPRICGANVIIGMALVMTGPLPPHMRGKPLRRYFTPAMLPSTPAYAGQTLPTSMTGVVIGLYPRICGANFTTTEMTDQMPPLPPHMRGKR